MFLLLGLQVHKFSAFGNKGYGGINWVYVVREGSWHIRFGITDIFTFNLFDWQGDDMKTNRYNDKVVQKEEWIKSDTVVITYTDGKKETMSRKSYEQIIQEVKP